MTRHRRRNNKERDIVIPVENEPADDSRWQHFSNEDYIVFCFRENGAFDVVKETSRPVNRKLNYGAEAKTGVKRYGNEEKLNRNGCDGHVMVSNQKDEEESIYFDAEGPTNGMRRRYHIAHEVEDRLASVGSSESNQSDGSNGSFAFPVLGWEWMGSPMEMPKSDGRQLRKHKARCVGFQCFGI
ncbi:protein BREAKING OF ASYMMETRY IN THE STOMATAL LINEAGE-like [Corylus avellana]|uniref:protein BREAKING OF ASYMMETRY IN THE STOMATAL LINEAGE-like n=1 Tax=Corylus avellana TaxID=13451 RepID=UPI00286C4A09|nr:protein BREAKING OF ASYMMETRY IN THE STOMATAL LINEAGE-like [Corylus avellana]